MELKLLVDDLIKLLENTNKKDKYFLNRYSKLIDELRKMVDDVEHNIYSRDFVVLPMFHYIDRNADDSLIYDKMTLINNWYISNYRKKDEATEIREMVIGYLCSECKMSENRAKNVLKGLAKHKDIYLEFAEYVKSGKFVNEAVTIEGYTAEQLHSNYPLSVVGAYNYLVYLVEEPEKAIADLKAGLPRK